MEKITDKAIADLLEKDTPTPAVTIYMPVHKSATPPHITEDHIRFKNLIHKAMDDLKKGNYGDDVTTALDQQLNKAMTDLSYWDNPTEGLLICAEPGKLVLFHLPIDTEEYVAVDNKYHLAPVLGLLHDALEFYLLTVVQHKPRLFTGDMYGLYKTDIELPVSVEVGLNIDENNQNSEHQRSASGSSLNTSGFHGRGGAHNISEEDRAKFWRMIDNIVCRRADRRLPMILAGIDAETAEYRHVSKYQKILSGNIHGSFSDTRPDELYERAQAIVREKLITPVHMQAVEEYAQMRGSNPVRAAGDNTTIAQAAEQGRIGTLLVNMSRLTTDTVRDTFQAVNRITFPEGGLSSAVNDLAIKVTRMSGSVIGLDASQMPNGAAMAAVFRY